MPSNFRRGLARLLFLCVACALPASAAHAQSQATTGNIEGRVLDPAGASVPGAAVSARSQQTGFERAATSDEDGVYRLILLPPGTYRVVVTPGTGFKALTYENVQVTVGGQTTLDINLTVSGENVVIDVASESSVVELGRTSISTTVNERAIENLPVNGRNYLDFATLTPGVVRDPTRVGDLSVGGQKGTLNNLQVDGSDNNNTFFGQAFGRTGVRPPYQFSEESVKEFQVNQNGFSAEFGRAGGAVINVVTKSGTNEFHGGLFEYFRDESLNANLPNVKAQLIPGTTLPRPNKRPPTQINQFGGRVGGPIVRDRAFFFFTYDGQRTKFLNVLEVPAIPAALQPFFLPKLSPYQVDRNQDVFMAKVDWAVDESNQLSLRFNRQNFTGVNNEFTGAQAAEEHSGDSLAKTTTMTANLTSTFSPQIVNEFRLQFARDEEPGSANSTAPELLIRTGIGTLNFGRNNFSPRETTIRRAQVVDNVSYVRGSHNLRAGVDYLLDSTFNFFPGFFGGQYQYNSLADFPNNPASFTQRFGGAGLGAVSHPDTRDLGLFLQDDWRVTPKLTFNLGVRYDYQWMSDPPIRNTDARLLANNLDTSFVPRDRDNFAPRAGFSWAPDARTVLRGGYGIFYGRTTGIMLGTTHTGNGVQTTGLTLSGAAAIAARGLTYPNVLPGLPAGVAQSPDLFLFAREYEQPYVQQGRLGFEREIFDGMSVSATYLFFKGVHLSRTRDINLAVPVATTFLAPGTSTETFTVERFPAARPISGYTRINLFESTGNSRYDGLALEARRRFANRFQFLASYTYSVAKDDRPDQTAVVPGGGDDAKIVFNQKDIRQDYSYADADLRHRFVFSPIYELGRVAADNSVLSAILSDYTFSGIVQLQSGFAFSQGVNADINRDGNSRNDRVPETCRNCYRTPATYQFDARVARRIRFGEDLSLRLILEGFNIFNRANPATLNSNFFNGFNATTLRFNAPAAATAFGTPRTFLNARELQLAVKFDF
ncbi:MAG: TonB-dependent receptor [Acidobacteria bacterium]|nr:TonB-dependent receptor [Acidobacteriota bacterium]